MADQTRPNAQVLATWLRDVIAQGGKYNLDKRGDLTRLAADAGVVRSVLSKALNAENIPDDITLKKIGKALGLTLGDMLVGAEIAVLDDFPTPAKVVQVPVDPLAADIEEFVQGLPPKIADKFREQAMEIRRRADEQARAQLRDLADIARLADGTSGEST